MRIYFTGHVFGIRCLDGFRRVWEFLGRGMVGGLLSLLGAAAGLALANSPAHGVFDAVAQTHIGPSGLGFGLTVSQWVQDGLLTVFFFTTGLELITEMRIGSLRDVRKAAVPIFAACGGVMVPACIFVAVIMSTGATQYLRGWAIPVSTDIAFAQCVLMLVGKGLHPFLRIFLLTLATVDDLMGILIIAVCYAGSVHVVPLLGAMALVLLFALLCRLRKLRWWLLVPIALLAWACMWRSGVEATIVGVLLGVMVPVRKIGHDPLPRSSWVQEYVQPFTNALVLPLFALFATNVPIALHQQDGLPLFADPLLWAVASGLMLGKPIGVMASTAVVVRWCGLRLPDGVRLRDLIPISVLCGIGFTVSMLIAGLSFASKTTVAVARTGVLLGSLVSAVVGGVLVRCSVRRAQSRARRSQGSIPASRRCG